MFKDDDKIKNPVTNGKTKKMILLSIVFLFSISISCIILLFILSFFFWQMRPLLAIIIISFCSANVASCTVGISYAIKKFFDTRDNKEKDKYKLEKMVIKNNRIAIKLNHKLEMSKYYKA